ncbi:MAG: LLM class flavin-dependent oxidoreductase [Nostocoides sp.]
MAPPLSIGLVLTNRGPMIGATSVPELLELARAADESTWDSVWVGDSLLAKPRVEALSMLNAIAATTQRVRLGAACLASVPLRDPVLLAHQWASLDVISGGRTIFVACQGGGPGQGDFDAELAAFGVRRAERPRRMEESIDIIRRLWAGEEVTFDGEFRTLRRVRVAPRPQQARVPVWIAANPDLRKSRNVATAFSRVARLADGWQVTHTSAQGVARGRELIGEYAAAAGRELGRDFDVCVVMNIAVAETEEAGFLEAKRFLEAHSATTYDRDFLHTWVAAGPPARCAEVIRPYIEAGANSILLRMSSFSQRGQFDRITAEVLPLLRV